jgi:hypothetical protein
MGALKSRGVKITRERLREALRRGMAKLLFNSLAIFFKGNASSWDSQ